MATTRIIPHHIGKGKSILSSIKDSLDYGKNPNKTRDGEFISYYKCSPKTVDYEFILEKNKYVSITGRKQSKEQNILLYQIRQSFKPGTISPEKANDIGYELAMRFTKGNHAFIVTTHEDKAHVHSHIYFNSTAIDCTHKFKNFWGSARAVRRLSDQICIENGLSIIESPKPSKGHYGTWSGNKKNSSNRDILKQDIDAVLSQNPKDFKKFSTLMQEIGYKIKQGKNLTFENSKFNKPIRCNSLKGNYTEEILQERIEGKRELQTSVKNTVNNSIKVNLLIDIENSIKTKNSPKYEQWAKIFNLKQAAQTLIYLQENNIDEYEKLEKKVIQKNNLYYDLLEKMKLIKNRLSEIKDIEKHIGNYGKTKDIYTEYRKSNYSKKFFSEFESQIILHQTAKKVFESLKLKKLPNIKMLKIEYATLKSEKKTLYNEYQKTKNDVKKLNIVKSNTDRLLKYSKNVKNNKEQGIEK